MDTPAAPFEPLKINGESITLDTTGKVLVLPTGNTYLLPSYNEYTLTGGRALPAAGTYTFSNDYDSTLGILNLNRNWIAIFDPADTNIDFFLFTYKSTSLKYTVDASGIITQLVLYPGNGMVYHGSIVYSELTRDTNSDLIPDVLDSSILGSLPSFIQSYATVDGTPGTVQFLTSDSKEFLTSASSYLFVRA